MFYKKFFQIISEKELELVRQDLLSYSEKISIINSSEYNIRVCMKNKYGTGLDVNSEIVLSKTEDDKTQIDITNRFDLITDITTIFVFILCWGQLINKLFNNMEVLYFEWIILTAFPILSVVLVKYSFVIYNQRLLKIYNSLLSD